MFFPRTLCSSGNISCINISRKREREREPEEGALLSRRKGTLVTKKGNFGNELGNFSNDRKLLSLF